MQLSKALYQSGYFISGILYCIHKQRIDGLIFSRPYLLLPVSAILSAVIIPNIIASSLAGIGFSVILAAIITKRGGRTTDRIVSLSKYTYTIYLLSYFPQTLIRGPIHSHFDIAPFWLQISSIAAGFFLPVVAGHIVDRLKRRNGLMVPAARLIGL